MRIFVCISATLGGIFLKLCTSHSPHMHYKRRGFGCDRLLTKGTLLGELSSFSAASWLSLEEFSSQFVLRTSGMRHKTRNFDCFRSIIKGTLRGEPLNIFVLISASVGGIFLKIHTSQSLRMRYKLCRFGCDPSLIKGILLGELSTYSALLRLEMEGFFLKFISRNFRACSTNKIRLVVLGHYLTGILLGE
jgi:hypothetical protein